MDKTAARDIAIELEFLRLERELRRPPPPLPFPSQSPAAVAWAEMIENWNRPYNNPRDRAALAGYLPGTPSRDG